MPRPNIIVIGADGIGKTPIAKKLATYFDVPYFKSNIEKEIFNSAGMPETLWFDYMLTQFLEQSGCGMISDRGYPCEYVYANVFGRNTNTTMLRAIDDAHVKLGTVIIHLYASTPPVKEDELVPAHKFAAVSEMYLAFLTCFTKVKNIISYDSSQHLHLPVGERAIVDASAIYDRIV